MRDVRVLLSKPAQQKEADAEEPRLTTVSEATVPESTPKKELQLALRPQTPATAQRQRDMSLLTQRSFPDPQVVDSEDSSCEDSEDGVTGPDTCELLQLLRGEDEGDVFTQAEAEAKFQQLQEAKARLGWPSASVPVLPPEECALMAKKLIQPEDRRDLRRMIRLHMQRQ